MKSSVLISMFICIIRTTTATIDLDKLTETVSSNIQMLTDKAAEGIQQFTDSIDLQKLQDYDFLHILPKIQYGKELAESLIEKKKRKLQYGKVLAESLIEKKKRKISKIFPPSQQETLKYYGERVHNIRPNKEIPWPEMRRINTF